MKKHILLSALAFLTFITIECHAQLPTGSIAPDWTFTDINGVSHHLYADLDAGKTVYLDLSTTWCAGCWDWHTSGYIETLWQNHGPIGQPGVSPSSTNDILFYLMECDGSNNYACLIGDNVNCTNVYNEASMGNWVTGTNYPIIDPPSPAIDVFNTNYQSGSYPTIFVICPDRSLTNYWNNAPPDMYQAATCATASAGADARMRVMDLFPPLLESCDSVIPAFHISNNGSSTLTSANIAFKVDGITQKNYHWTGSLPTYHDALISGIKVGSSVPGHHTASVVVSSPNGLTDPTPSNNTAALSFNIYPSVGPLVSESFEASGIPSSWTIGNGGHAPTWTTGSVGYNSSKSAFLNWNDSIPDMYEVDLFNIKAQSFANAGSASLTFDVAYCESFYQYNLAELDVEISTDCGITWLSKYAKIGNALATKPYSNNPFVPASAADWRHETVNLTSAAGQSHVLIRFKATSANGNNLYIDNINVTAAVTTGIEEAGRINTINVYPNPITNNATIDFNLVKDADNVSILLVNELGQEVLNKNLGHLSSGEQNYNLNVSALNNGLYLLKIKTGENIITKKVFIDK